MLKSAVSIQFGDGDRRGNKIRILTKLRGHDDGDRAAELHGEATRGRVQGDAVTEVAHDVVAVRPETDDNGRTAKCEDPGRDGRLVAELPGAPDEVNGREGADSAKEVRQSRSERLAVI